MSSHTKKSAQQTPQKLWRLDHYDTHFHASSLPFGLTPVYVLQGFVTQKSV